MSGNPAPVYISSSGTLGSRPLSVKVKDGAYNWWMLFYLFWETLLLPMVNPNMFANPSMRPEKRPSGAKPGPGGPSGGGGGGGGYPKGGGGGSGGGGGGGTWRGNSGGGFKTMSDLTGGDTVDGCRATCG